MSSYIPIASQTLGSSASSVTFSSIPTTLNGKTLRDLVVVINGVPSTSASLALRFNADSGANYPYVLMEGHPTLGPRSAATTGTDLSIGFVTTNFVGIASVMDYAQTNKHKSAIARADDGGNRTTATAGRWANTAAITSLTVLVGSGTFNTGTTFNLFGIEG